MLIKTEADYKTALTLVQKLWDAKPNTTKGDKLETLLILVDAYEAKHYPIAPPTPLEAIKFRMEQMGLKKVDVARIIGGKNRVSEIFSGKKSLTKKMIESLHYELGIPYESLFGPHDFTSGTQRHRITLDTKVTIGKSGPVRETVDCR